MYLKWKTKHAFKFLIFIFIFYRNLIKLQEVGISAPLYAIFNNGLAYKYIEGTTLTTETVVVPKIYKSVARQMAKLHKSINNNNKNVPMLWNKCSRFLELIPEKYNDPDKQKRYLFFSIFICDLFYLFLHSTIVSKRSVA